MTNTITYSHKYKKHEKISLHDHSRLLEVFVKIRSDMHPSFVEYDTALADRPYNFRLKEGKYLVLLLQDSNGLLHTTVRPHNDEKEEYYKSKRGQLFNINMGHTKISKTQKGLEEWSNKT
jgi:hypothetical protein